MGRWRRHIYQGVADTLERKHGLPPGTMLETPWEELDPRAAARCAVGHRRRAHHVHLAQRPGGLQIRRQVRGHHSQAARRSTATPRAACSAASWKSTCACSAAAAATAQRLNPQARAVTLTTRACREFADRPERSLPEVCALAISDAVEFFSELELDDTRPDDRRRSAQGNSRPAADFCSTSGSTI